jgi:hypothetical protein
MQITDAKDSRGRSIEVGDHIIYGVGKGYLNIAYVAEVRVKEAERWSWDANTGKRQTTTYQTLVLKCLDLDRSSNVPSTRKLTLTRLTEYVVIKQSELVEFNTIK